MGLKKRQPQRQLSLALPKGRILADLAPMFARAGVDISGVGKSRKLITQVGGLNIILVRASDVPAYVSGGAADLGVCGLDVLLESGVDLYQPVDLGIAKCRMIVAKPRSAPDPSARTHMRIATKYPNIAKSWAHRNGYSADIIKLSGSVELGPLVSLSDYIVDITETGKTLAANGLIECGQILEISSRLAVNPSSWHLYSRPVTDLIKRIEKAVR